MPIDPESQLGRNLADNPLGPTDLPLSPLSAPVAIGMQAIGRAGGRPLQDLVLRANAILASYAPEWAQSVADLPVAFSKPLRYLGAYDPGEPLVVLGPRTWAATKQGLAGQQRPLATLLHEAAHHRIRDVPEAAAWMPTGARSIPPGLAVTNAPYGLTDVPGEVLADAMRTRLMRRAMPQVDMLGARIGGWYDPGRSLGWLKASDATTLQSLLDALVR